MRRWIWGLLVVASLAMVGLTWRATARHGSRPTQAVSSTSGGATVPPRFVIAKPTITPPAALANDQAFSVEPVHLKDARLGGFKPAGPVYKFGPSGRTFPQPVTIEVPYDPRIAAKGAALSLWTRAETQADWQRVDGIVMDEQRHLLVAQVSHFSLYASGQDCTDLDGDGYSPCTGDCDETNPQINPGADEICYDRIDQNCNGILDEGCPSEW